MPFHHRRRVRKSIRMKAAGLCTAWRCGLEKAADIFLVSFFLVLTVALFIFTPAASVQTHLLRQEVRGQRQPGDHQPAGLVPVRCVPLGHPQPSGLLGKHLRAAGGRPRQPLRFSRQPLRRLCPYGTDPRRQLTAGPPERQQLQVRPTQVQPSPD